jgi:hypothetical protein
MPGKIAQKVQENNERFRQSIKTRIFDIIGFFSVAALMAISLGVLEGRRVTINELINVIIDFLPFYFTFVLLGTNFYKKGSYIGKETDKFNDTCISYSDIISQLSDAEISTLDVFCEEYNERALRDRQLPHLKRAVITYKMFNEGDAEKDIQPLRLWSNKELINKYGKERAKHIINAKNEKVKGVKTNALLGTNNTDDTTDLGDDEATLSKKHTRSNAINYAATTMLMTFIAVKDVMSWNWIGFALVAFKCVFVLCKAYLEYFTGYDSITINLVNHINRKADILRQFRQWYKDKYTVVKIENEQISLEDLQN